MNIIHNNYNIYICPESEISDLQHFICNNWVVKNHILSTNIELMNWQHYNEKDKCYSWVIARHTETKEIHSILGFIQPSHFDELITEKDLWLSFWLTKANINYSVLGLVILNYLITFINPRCVIAFGIKPHTIPIYKTLGYTVGELNHFYLVNTQFKSFNLIGNFDNLYHHESSSKINNKLIKFDKPKFLKKISGLKDFSLNPRIPTKSFTYLYNRYICHPIYDYHIYGVKNNDTIKGFLILRIASHNNNNAIRIVDYFGDVDNLTGIFIELQKILKEFSAEYIDFYNIGISEKLLNSNGFLKRTLSSKVIIPNYFEPFVKENIIVYYAYKNNTNKELFIFRGDSDQDRPSIIS